MSDSILVQAESYSVLAMIDESFYTNIYYNKQ